MRVPGPDVRGGGLGLGQDLRRPRQPAVGRPGLRALPGRPGPTRPAPFPGPGRGAGHRPRPGGHPPAWARGRGYARPSPPTGRPSYDLGEHRLVSVLFVELSGPVGSGSGLDPEDVRDIVGTRVGGGDRRSRGPGRHGDVVVGGRAGRPFRCARGSRGRPRAGRESRLPHFGGARSRAQPVGRAEAVGPCRHRNRRRRGRADRRHPRVRRRRRGRGHRRRFAIGGEDLLGPGRAGHPGGNGGRVRWGPERGSGRRAAGQAGGGLLPGGAQGAARRPIAVGAG